MQLLSTISLLLLGVCLGWASPSGRTEVKLERGDCPLFWFNFRGRCYKFVSTRMTWAEAELHCQSQNANLVSIYSTEENKFVRTVIQNYDHTQPQTWIGLSDAHKEKSWMWSDGCAASFRLWINGQPDDTHGEENCAEINWGGQELWNDRSCSERSPSVCATRKAVC